ncbi:hypothetical protein Acidovoranil_19030 [Acidovorax sp. FG27]
MILTRPAAGLAATGAAPPRNDKARHWPGFVGKDGPGAAFEWADQWNCSSSVEPVSAFTLEEPPWITVVTSSK